MTEITATGSYSVPLTTVLDNMQKTLTKLDGSIEDLGRRQDKTDVILERLSETTTELNAARAAQVKADTRLTLLEERQPADVKERLQRLEANRPLTVPQRVSLWGGVAGLVLSLLTLAGYIINAVA